MYRKHIFILSDQAELNSVQSFLISNRFSIAFCAICYIFIVHCCRLPATTPPVLSCSKRIVSNLTVRRDFFSYKFIMCIYTTLMATLFLDPHSMWSCPHRRCLPNSNSLCTLWHKQNLHRREANLQILNHTRLRNIH